jgi:anti-anti-sigma factor
VAIRLTHDKTEAHARLTIDGRFTFDLYRTFLDTIDELAGNVRHVTVDLRNAGYMDSAALGLLIQMRQKLAGCGTTLKVKRGSVIDDVLRVANFHKMFAIEAD